MQQEETRKEQLSLVTKSPSDASFNEEDECCSPDQPADKERLSMTSEQSTASQRALKPSNKVRALCVFVLCYLPLPPPSLASIFRESVENKNFKTAWPNSCVFYFWLPRLFKINGLEIWYQIYV